MMPADPLEQAHRMELERAICLAMIEHDPSPEAVRDGTALVIEYRAACRAEERASLASAPEASVMEEAEAELCHITATEGAITHREVVCRLAPILTRPLAARVAELEVALDSAVMLHRGVSTVPHEELDGRWQGLVTEWGKRLERAQAAEAENARLKARVEELEAMLRTCGCGLKELGGAP